MAWAAPGTVTETWAQLELTVQHDEDSCVSAVVRRPGEPSSSEIYTA